MKTNSVPKIRFKGFTDDWEERKLGEVVEGEIKGKAKANMQGNRSIYLETEYLNGGETTFVDSDADVEEDDILILWDGSQAGTVYHGFFGALGSTLKAYRPKESGKFVYYQLVAHQEMIFQRYRTPNIPHVIKTFTEEFSVFTTSLPEQERIGNFFKQLDNIIALHQRKLDLLKEQKKGFLQKMFPKNGEKVPELRFAGFADDWEERKLGELALVLTGFPFKNEDFVDNGKYLVITNGNIQNESSTVDVSLGNRVDDLSDEIKERYYLNKNDILVTMDGTVGRTAKVVDDNLILAQRVARLVANKNTEFVYQWLNQGSFFNEMTKVSHGGTIKHISLNEISNYSATVPSNNIEQQKIGSFFKQLDDTIALHQRKLDLLKEQKKGFLQKMFV